MKKNKEKNNKAKENNIVPFKKDIYEKILEEFDTYL